MQTESAMSKTPAGMSPCGGRDVGWGAVRGAGEPRGTRWRCRSPSCPWGTLVTLWLLKAVLDPWNVQNGTRCLLVLTDFHMALPAQDMRVSRNFGRIRRYILRGKGWIAAARFCGARGAKQQLRDKSGCLRTVQIRWSKVGVIHIEHFSVLRLSWKIFLKDVAKNHHLPCEILHLEFTFPLPKVAAFFSSVDEGQVYLQPIIFLYQTLPFSRHPLPTKENNSGRRCHLNISVEIIKLF